MDPGRPDVRGLFCENLSAGIRKILNSTGNGQPFLAERADHYKYMIGVLNYLSCHSCPLMGKIGGKDYEKISFDAADGAGTGIVFRRSLCR